jgi:hypothetical protein
MTNQNPGEPRLSTASSSSSYGPPLVPVKVVPWLVAVVGLAGAAVQTLPPHTIAWKVAAAITSFGGLFGVVSPGLRRSP